MKKILALILLISILFVHSESRRHHHGSKKHSRSNRNDHSNQNRNNHRNNNDRTSNRSPKVYEYNALAMSWLGQFCSQTYISCAAGWDTGKLWDGKKFTIHGLWPQYDHPYDGRDPNCKTYSVRSLDIQELFSDNEQMLKDLVIYWPELNTKKSGNWFYLHEWNNHGSCYMLNVINGNPDLKAEYEKDSAAFTTKMQRAYFSRAIELAKSIDVTSAKSDYVDQNDFAQSIGIPATQFYLVFGNDNELDEVRFCYTLAKTPGEETLMDCPEWDQKTFRATPFVIPHRTVAPTEEL